MYRIRGVTKDYLVGKKAMPALREINFDIRKNELVAILGTSGCGKSTLLRMLAGFLKSTTGAIYAQDKAITGPGADRGMVFQSYTLFPWLTVKENVAYGLKELKVAKAEREKIVARYLHDVGLDGFESAYPRELSGGMKQRVAIARALAINPDSLLLDEPFGALDAQTRSHMQEMMLNVWQKHPKTIIMVTHDIEEAIFMADRVVVMRAHPGSIKEVIDIELPRDRDFHIKSDPRFIQYKADILQLIYEESPAAQRQLMEA
ncbi:MAG: ABC transporter ATP-binding protein [Oscillospiraceae bacterium]|nr:ABC transporter ATP-binding protein [Oscillospiraceae bacterium]